MTGNNLTDGLRDGDGCPSELTLDDLHLGTLPAPEKARVETHAAGCEHCTARLATRSQGFAAFESVDADALFNRIADAATPEPEPSLFTRFLDWLMTPQGLGAVALAAACLVAVNVLNAPTPAGVTDDPGIRAKGGPGLHVFVHRDGRAQEAVSGDTFHAGEVLRFVVDAKTAGHGLILYQDSKGAQSTAWPLGAEASVPVAAGDKQELEGGVELDQSAGRERLTFVLCPQPFTVDQIPPTCPRTAFELEKSP